MRGRRGGSAQFATRIGEPLLHVGKFQTEQRRTGSEDKIDTGRHKSLVSAINFTETTFRAVTVNGVAHGRAGGDDTYTRSRARELSGTNPPSQEKSPAVDAATLLTHGTKIVIAPQTLPGAEIHLKQP